MSAINAAVVLCDVVESRSVDGFLELRDERLGRLSRDHRSRELVSAPYTVTTWDEFQNIAPRPSATPTLVWDLRCAFRPHELRIAVGFGSVEAPAADGQPMNVSASGTAFERAREGMDRLKNGSGTKYRTLTAFATGDPQLDRTVNLVYRLHDTLVQEITRRQWEVILALRRTGRQDRTAELLEIDESTVSRNLRRGFWWQVEDTRSTLEELLSDCT
jgi:hypothetical protein